MHAPRAIHNPQFGAWYSDTDTGRHAASSSSHGHFARPAVADTDFAGPPNLQLPHRPTLRSSAVPGKMQRPTAAAEEYAALQKLSDEYQPVVVGPLVGKRQSSQAIAAEYATADPVYVVKTQALPQTYSHYRTVQGDGNCGWRAIAFTYFEALQRSGNRDRILAEQTRLKSLNNLLSRVGFQPHLYEDFVDETITLLAQLATIAPRRAEAAALVEGRFNDGAASSAIITHLRLLTSAWMKANADAYQPFITDATVEQYCATHVEPYQVEIDHFGMNALIDVLVKPARFAVEVLYLDRSDGSQVNTHRFEATGANGMPLFPDASTIYLLYRPGHYDILYRKDELHVNYNVEDPAFGSPEPTPLVPNSREYITILADIPGMSLMPNQQDPFPEPVPVSVQLPLAADYANSLIGSIPNAYPSSGMPTSPLVAGVGGGLTQSRWTYEYEGMQRPKPKPQHYQTPTFKNSHYNPAHFLSADFQPEMWTPDIEHGHRASHSEYYRHH